MQPRSFIAAALCASLLSACTQGATGAGDAARKGQVIYAKECAACHGSAGQGAGDASLGLGGPAPDLTGLNARNDGYFPREFVRRFVLGLLETDDPAAAMPDFATVGLQHVYPNGGADGEVLEADIENLLDYLETIQQ